VLPGSLVKEEAYSEIGGADVGRAAQGNQKASKKGGVGGETERLKEGTSEEGLRRPGDQETPIRRLVYLNTAMGWGGGRRKDLEKLSELYEIPRGGTPFYATKPPRPWGGRRGEGETGRNPS